jgi:hypothetical protein
MYMGNEIDKFLGNIGKTLPELINIHGNILE